MLGYVITVMGVAGYSQSKASAAGSKPAPAGQSAEGYEPVSLMASAVGSGDKGGQQGPGGVYGGGLAGSSGYGGQHAFRTSRDQV
jgi:hypothetical protein